MGTALRFCLAVTILMLATSWGTSSADAAGLRLSASSISATNGEPWLLYGDGLDDPALKIHVATLDPGKEWNPAESLQRVLDGKVNVPEKPPQGAVAVGVYAADAHTAAIKPFANRWQPLAKMVWAETSLGCSPPLAVNRPEVWAVLPGRLVAGSRARLFGPNMGSHIALVKSDKRITICRWSYSFSLEKGLSPAFERTFEVPADLPPGNLPASISTGHWSRCRSEPAWNT